MSSRSRAESRNGWPPRGRGELPEPPARRGPEGLAAGRAGAGILLHVRPVDDLAARLALGPEALGRDLARLVLAEEPGHAALPRRAVAVGRGARRGLQRP